VTVGPTAGEDNVATLSVYAYQHLYSMLKNPSIDPTVRGCVSTDSLGVTDQLTKIWSRPA
jgi:hypothetical protein